MQLSYESSDNSLRLTLDGTHETPTERMSLTGYVDMGTGGRLVGLEFLKPDSLDLRQALAKWMDDEAAEEFVSLAGDSAYIELSTPEDASLNEQTRSTEAIFAADLDAQRQLIALSIPRRGAGYEITYPSGNQ